MMRIAARLCLTALLLWTSAGFAAATEKPSLVIGVYGDSLGDGVWSGLYNILRPNPSVKVARRSKVGAGLTRPDYVTWFGDMKTQLAAEPIDVAVIMVGANDQQSIRDEARKGYLYQSDGWKQIYKDRITTLVTEFRERGIQVIWVGLPIMRRDELNTGAVYLNALFAELAPASGATFIPLFDEFRGEDGHFATHLPDASQKSRQVRGEDGVHFTHYGYELIAAKVVARIPKLRPELRASVSPN